VEATDGEITLIQWYWKRRISLNSKLWT